MEPQGEGAERVGAGLHRPGQVEMTEIDVPQKLQRARASDDSDHGRGSVLSPRDKPGGDGSVRYPFRRPNRR